MKKYLLIIPVLLLFFPFNTNKKTVQPNCKRKILVVSYNVENLFDTIDNPHKRDNEFTPQSPKHWNTKRYYKKINDISNVLAAISKHHLPDLISLEEVENRAVIEDLIKTKKLKKEKYGIVHEECTDPRGIDVALLYNPRVFKYISHKQIPIIDSTGFRYHTREILLTKGIVDRDTLYVFVNHWKSRYGGAKKTEFKRILVAKILRRSIDSVFKINPKANILCLGDFNDTPTNKSIEKVLDASIEPVFNSKKELFNLAAYQALHKKGTIIYRDHWYMIDNIIISQNMLKKSNRIYAQGPAKIYKSKLNLYYNPKANDSIPNRTYGGNTYFGGVSDHLPVYEYFKLK